MAGMFYTLKEAAEKLHKSEDEIKALVKEGKLREFRTGNDLFFKIEEVNSLMSESFEMPSEIKEGNEPADIDFGGEEELSILDEISEEEQPISETGGDELEIAAEEPQMEEINIEPLQFEEDMTSGSDELNILDDTSEEKAASAEAEPAKASGEGEFDLVQEDGDTIVGGEDINILDETSEAVTPASDTDFQLSDDTLSATQAAGSMGGFGDEASLEDIEGDVNLDTFGSGSGLLDLSLQADDTSLGGILDEIYSPEGGAEGHAAEIPSGEGPAPHGDEIMGDIGAEEPAISAPSMAAMGTGFVEAQPDSLSNAFGIMLFLPFLALIYAGIISISGFNDIMPTILEKLPSGYMLWYILAGVLVVALLIPSAAFLLSGSSNKPKKEKKAKKQPKTKKVKSQKK